MANGQMQVKCSSLMGNPLKNKLCRNYMFRCILACPLFRSVVQDGRLLFFAGGLACHPDKPQTTIVRVFDMSVPEKNATVLTHGLKIGKKS